MKRSLLLVALTLLVLSVPSTASACTEVCETVFGPCVYEINTSSFCKWSNNVCWMEYCRTGNPSPGSESLTTKWKIASVEIEQRGPARSRESEIRVTSRETAPAPVKSESSLE